MRVHDGNNLITKYFRVGRAVRKSVSNLAVFRLVKFRDRVMFTVIATDPVTYSVN